MMSQVICVENGSSRNRNGNRQDGWTGQECENELEIFEWDNGSIRIAIKLILKGGLNRTKERRLLQEGWMVYLRTQK
jgi:hypothetical protein